MKLEGSRRLIRKLKDLPDEVRVDLAKSIRTGTEEGARVARTLTPVASGKTREEITTRYADGGLTGIVEVIGPTADQADKDRAYSIEHGRQAGDRGTTEGSHHVRTTRSYLAKKNMARVSRAVRKAVKRVASSG